MNAWIVLWWPLNFLWPALAPSTSDDDLLETWKPWILLIFQYLPSPTCPADVLSVLPALSSHLISLLPAHLPPINHLSQYIYAPVRAPLLLGRQSCFSFSSSVLARMSLLTEVLVGRRLFLVCLIEPDLVPCIFNVVLTLTQLLVDCCWLILHK